MNKIIVFLAAVMIVCQLGVLEVRAVEDDKVKDIGLVFTNSSSNSANNNFYFLEGDNVVIPFEISYTTMDELVFISLELTAVGGRRPVITRDTRYNDYYSSKVGGTYMYENNQVDASGKNLNIPAGTYTHRFFLTDSADAVTSGEFDYTIKLQKLGYQIPEMVKELEAELVLEYSTGNCENNDHIKPCERVHVKIYAKNRSNLKTTYSMKDVTLQYYVYVEENRNVWDTVKPGVIPANATSVISYLDSTYLKKTSGNAPVYIVGGVNGWPRQCTVGIEKLDQIMEFPNGKIANAKITIVYDNNPDKSFNTDDIWLIFDFALPTTLLKAYTEEAAIYHKDGIVGGKSTVEEPTAPIGLEANMNITGTATVSQNPPAVVDGGLSFIGTYSKTGERTNIVKNGRFQAKLSFDVRPESAITNDNEQYSDGRIDIILGNGRGEKPANFKIVRIIESNKPWVKIGEGGKSLVIESAAVMGTGKKEIKLIIDFDDALLRDGDTTSIIVEDFEASVMKYTPPAPVEESEEQGEGTWSEVSFMDISASWNPLKFIIVPNPKIN